MSNLRLPSVDTMYIFNNTQLFEVIKATRAQMVTMHNLLTPDIAYQLQQEAFLSISFLKGLFKAPK